MLGNVWDKIFSNQSWGKYPAEPLIRFVAKNFYNKDRKSVHILELGCGPGANLWYLAREGFTFTGIEYSSSAVQQAEYRLDNECPDWRNRGKIMMDDITKVDLGKDKYDVIIDNECVYCIPFDQSCDIYAKARRALSVANTTGQAGDVGVSSPAWQEDLSAMNCGRRLSRCCHRSSPRPKADVAAQLMTERPSTASCSCCRRVSRGKTCPKSWGWAAV